MTMQSDETNETPDQISNWMSQEVDRTVFTAYAVKFTLFENSAFIETLHLKIYRKTGIDYEARCVNGRSS